MLPGTPAFSRVWNLPPATLEELRREFDNAVGSVSGAVSRTCGGHLPLSVWESDEQLVVEIDVPGVCESDLAVSVEDSVLTVSGRRNPPDHAGEQKHFEGRYGEYTRSIKLHGSLDTTSIQAELDNGVLTLSIARRVEAQPRSIPVAVRSRAVEARPERPIEESAEGSS